MKEKVLVEIGFSKNEAKIYLALLELGSSTTTVLSKLSKVHRSNVYDALERLIKKGAVSYIIKNQKKYYEATDPINLINVLKEKEKILQNIIPELVLSKKLASKKSEVHIFEGVRAIKNILEHFLELKDERYVYGAPKFASEKLGKGWLEEYHKKRIKIKQPMKQIYNEEAIERAKYLNKLSYTEIRCLPKEYDSPVATTICSNQVVLMLWLKEPEEPIAIQIINERIANAYKQYFELMWNLAKKP